jgi:tRNA(fMet)-specific endonuclease VapC
VRFLLDTDVCSAYLKGNSQVYSRFLQYSGRLHVSTITVAELCTWAMRAKAASGRLQDLLRFLDDVTILDVDRSVAHRFGEVRAHQLDQGVFTPEMDLLIAATSLVHNLTLVTHNVQDFANVPGLMLQDWLAP